MPKLNMKLAPTLQPTILDIAWAAGIYEGEGTYGKNNGICISQKDPWILYRLRALFGGTVAAKSPYVTNFGVDQEMYRWTLYGPRARGFVYTIFTFLSPRRRSQIRTKWRP